MQIDSRLDSVDDESVEQESDVKLNVMPDKSDIRARHFGFNSVDELVELGQYFCFGFACNGFRLSIIYCQPDNANFAVASV